jgi:hypothetical protein
MSMWNVPQHSYEEIRQVIIDILQRDPALGGYPRQFNDLLEQSGLSFTRREQAAGRPSNPALHPHDVELVRDVFWDLFRQGVITLGKDSSNDNWPWFRLSHFGTTTIRTLSPYRFHDVQSYLSLVQAAAPDILPEAVVYLEEAIAAFYADCLLSSCGYAGSCCGSRVSKALECRGERSAYVRLVHETGEGQGWSHPAQDCSVST